jgi:pyruvate dehydrogenase E1 component
MKINDDELDKLVKEWTDSIDHLIASMGSQVADVVFGRVSKYAYQNHLSSLNSFSTPYLNTILPEEEPEYPGNQQIEKTIRAYLRWNAVAIVLRANHKYPNIGGHLATYASAATLYEVGFHHFFRGPNSSNQDYIYFQGHSSPGIYARAFLEGRLTESQLNNFRHEAFSDGLSSYPHPRLMPNFWQFPTVSMGLGPLQAVHHAYILKYLISREIIQPNSSKVWAFVGDGEMDEPESSAALALAGRERLDNLIFVVNCNLQRLDGPVRGNTKIIQELESIFAGAGWNTIKVVWGSKWDELFKKDTEHVLINKLEQTCDGEYQRIATLDGNTLRKEYFGTNTKLLELVKDISDKDLARLPRGGHDPKKVYAAYLKAFNHENQPTVILAKTVKGWDLGSHIESRNASHAVKKMVNGDILDLAAKLGLEREIDLDKLKADDFIPGFLKLEQDSQEYKYLIDNRTKLGGFIPHRRSFTKSLELFDKVIFDEFYAGSKGQEVSTTSALAKMLRNLTRDSTMGKYIVPIVPDEGRSFGLEPLFAELGIYSQSGQKYKSVDAELILRYKETTKGQVLEEGISEAGAMCAFMALASGYSTFPQQMLPFFLFYSMFGFQRIGDLIWAALDMRSRGFLFGTTAGRTTYNGEGLQHEDGQSHLYAMAYPHLKAYDPAFAFELAVIVEQGLKDFIKNKEDLIYYVTTYNENYVMPKIPAGNRTNIKKGILNGVYLFDKDKSKGLNGRVAIWFSGPMFENAIKAKVLLNRFKIAADLWSLTSVKSLREEAMEIQRQNLIKGTQEKSYLETILDQINAPIVAVTDFMKAVPDLLKPYIKLPYETLGTEGFGLSDSRDSLRDYFETDYRYIAYRAITLLDKQDFLKDSEFQGLFKYDQSSMRRH